MITKVYKAHNNLSIPIVLDGKIAGYAEFKDERNTYRTSVEEFQTALEKLPAFGKLFVLQRTIKHETDKDHSGANNQQNETQQDTGEENSSKEKDNDADALGENVYADVTEWQTAKDILREKYSVHHASLNSPENILKKAEEVGVSFPGLKLPVE